MCGATRSKKVMRATHPPSPRPRARPPQLANVDWLHADAEQLLTLTNVIEVVGLKLTLDAVMKGNDAKPQPPLVPVVPVCAAVAVAAAGYTYFAAGGQLGDHTPYLGGLGNLCALQPRTPATQTPLLALA